VQISNVHIARPYHYRLFGIAKFDIVTAADRDLDRSEKDHKSKVFFLPIVDINIARTLSKQLLQAASKSRKGEHVYKDEDGDGIDDETGEEIPEGAEIENTGNTDEDEYQPDPLQSKSIRDVTLNPAAKATHDYGLSDQDTEKEMLDETDDEPITIESDDKGPIEYPTIKL
jgi:hypothetical protein